MSANDKAGNTAARAKREPALLWIFGCRKNG
jgi:hypothetical protein